MGEPTDEEINEIFLKRYKMSKEELQQMAEKMGIQLNNLCYLKQEFDAYDEDRSGYIDVKELKELLEKLGEELSEEELEQAFKELDSDGVERLSSSSLWNGSHLRIDGWPKVADKYVRRQSGPEC